MKSLLSENLNFVQNTVSKHNSSYQQTDSDTDDIEEIKENLGELEQIFQKNMSLRIQPKDDDQKKFFKVSNYKKNRNSTKVKIEKEAPQIEREYILMKTIDQDKQLQQLMMDECLTIVVSSAIYQNIENKMKHLILKKFSKVLPPNEIPMIYISENKIFAFEDCIKFAPQLFQLSKSIIVSEPIKSYQERIEQIERQSMALDSTNKKQGTVYSRMDSSFKTQTTYNNAQDKTDVESMTSHYYQDSRGSAFSRQYQSYRKTLKSFKNKDRSEIQKQLSHKYDEQEAVFRRIRKRAHVRQALEKNKKGKLNARSNKVLFNFGTMNDFFNYSAVNIQSSHRNINFNRPIFKDFASSAKFQLELYNKGYSVANSMNTATLKDEYSRNQTGDEVNMFAIAKVGLPNMIYPCSLDIRFSNYQDYANYMQLSDQFFPDNSKTQRTVIVLRPLIVKNGLNDFFVQILRANDFLVMKRTIRQLQKNEVTYYSKYEKIDPAMIDLYYNLMMDGPCEILVCCKVGAINDAVSLIDGANPYGRRRQNIINESSEGAASVRNNVDSMNSMFEIAPFTSFSEFIDLEDFLVRNANMKKYLKQYQQSSKQGPIDDLDRQKNQLYFSKVDEMRKALNIFQRYYNVAGVSSKEESDCYAQMCLLTPQMSKIEEVVLILNPLYSDLIDNAFELLQRNKFQILSHQMKSINRENALNLFENKVGYGPQGDKFIDHFIGQSVYFFHLTKIAGDKEMRALYNESSLVFDDFFKYQINKRAPIKMEQIPLMFVFVDTPLMFERCMKQLYLPHLCDLTGQDFVEKLSNDEKKQIIDRMLQITIGDKIKCLTFDSRGNLKSTRKNNKELDESNFDDFAREDDEDIFNNQQSLMGDKQEPQMEMVLSSQSVDEPIHYIVESQHHSLFEIRIHRLRCKGDEFFGGYADKTSIKEETEEFFQKFSALSMYYNEVNKNFYNIVPSFYRYKICPLIKDNDFMLNRVFEVEEYMGKKFIEELAELHQDHVKLLQHNKEMAMHTQKSYYKAARDDKERQQSLPGYMLGKKICAMVKNLEQITCAKNNLVRGTGPIIFKNNMLQGQYNQKVNYYEYTQEKYLNMLKKIKKSWHYYLSTMETDIIEEKVNFVLESNTFRYSRQPFFLRVMPDCMGEDNLRISKKINVLNNKDFEDRSEKFFKALQEQQVNPHREMEVDEQVESILTTLRQKNAKEKVDRDLIKQGMKIDDVIYEEKVDEKTQKKYSIHRDAAIVGTSIARRPKYQLIASILWLINFHHRKIERKSELFLGERDYNEIKDADMEYDDVLEIVKNSIYSNYGDDEVNLGLDMDDIKEGHESQFDRLMRQKIEEQLEREEKLVQKLEWAKVKWRTTAKFDDLRDAEIFKNHEKYDKLKEHTMKSKKVSKLNVDGDFNKELEAKLNQDDEQGDEAVKRNKKELMDFLNARQTNIDREGLIFYEFLKQSKARLGTYTLKMAQNFITKYKEKHLDIKNTRQEKISFVKMEYFLYGLTEGYNIIKKLQAIERNQKILEGKEKVRQEEMKQLQEKHDKLQTHYGVMSGANSYNYLSQDKLQGINKESKELQRIKELKEELQRLNKLLYDLRYRMTSLETQFILNMKELMQWDYFIPDHYFDKSHLEKKKQSNFQKEKFIIPLKTFWLPVMHDDNNSKAFDDQRYQAQIGEIKDYRKRTGVFLAEPLRKYAQGDKKRIDRIEKGGKIRTLQDFKEVNKAENIVFHKYISQGLYNELVGIDNLRDLVNDKTQMKKFDLDVPFGKETDSSTGDNSKDSRWEMYK